MSYCTPAEVRALIKNDLLTALLEDAYNDDPDTLEQKALPYLEQAIADACAEIDGYLGKRYPLPLATVPPTIAKLAKDMAAYNLITRVGVGKDDDRERNYRKRYEDAVGLLSMFAKGYIELGITPPGGTAAGGFRMSSPARVFSRDTLRGM